MWQPGNGKPCQTTIIQDLRYRINRHNNNVRYLRRNLNNQGYIVTNEPKLKVGDGIFNPDFLAIKENHSLILDVQVATDSREDYNRQDLKKIIKRESNIQDVKVLTATVNFRETWGPEAARDMVRNKILSKQELARISLRATLGTYSCFRNFNKLTTKRPTTEVG